ncbi:hypothetical protein CLAFUW4_05300 [Fulvia fulva]|uniref:Uncharacterized protein n=1 Tax=Passalora fulva TaxID=5499 RepID=A0A9Q8LIX5_PASFU|nr:uncharacterized protein CLAFUR5_05448 [Fulvia fulva]KAK4624706.1 hypothetical protein CLAFUR4_05294 [Fulvia fulva]KAK4624815.1 hypothetical protein CLAFUR0_05301 [Fulvia fulva]UJO18237.1 hypothetical protein CLAFUR5_05448 [Fulvia fulva]WPV14840.1 hypothetical protein CLAFUW4_05300 [Fulvia fulva]WPV29709.1 hypothetical protein CLAFUW7_05299 [Fulvia fulva]
MFVDGGSSSTGVNDQRDVKVDGMEALKQQYDGGADGDCVDSVEPDKMVLSDEHMFNIGPDIPEADAQALNDFLDADASIADIPPHQLAYEVESESVAERLVEAQGI